MKRRDVASLALVAAVIVVVVGAALGKGTSGSPATATAATNVNTGGNAGTSAAPTGTTSTSPTASAARAASIVAATSTTPVYASITSPGGTATCSMMSPGTHRLPSIDGRIPVVLHIGRTAKPGAPLILGIPGANEDASNFASYTQYSKLADRDGFSVAYPTATGKPEFWNISGTQAGKPDDLAYLRTVIPIVVHAACADPRRVGATGVSNGGGMSARLACDASDLIAAAAPVAGGYGSLPDCHPTRPVPILEVHSLTDRVVPYKGTGPNASGAVRAFLAQWRSLDHCTGKVRTTSPYRDITEQRWNTCAAGTKIQHDRVSDQDHGWPGQGDIIGRHEFSSTRATYTFLSRFELPVG